MSVLRLSEAGNACSGRDGCARQIWALCMKAVSELTAFDDAQELGTKARPKRPGRVSVGRAIRVRANHFKVPISALQPYCIAGAVLLSRCLYQ